MTPDEIMNQFGENSQRVLITTSCHDSDLLPKVPNAGGFTGENDSVQVMHNGVLITRDCYDGSWMTEVIKTLKGHHEPQEELVFKAILHRLQGSETPPVMIELGAYWCYYTLWFLNDFPSGNAICVEPDANNLEIGKENFRLNGRTATFHNALIGDGVNAQVDFYCYSDGVTRSVPIESLDSLITKFELSHIDILHADIQGAELSLLTGALNTLKRGAVRFLVVSTHHASISGDDFTHERCLELLESAGAHIIAQHNIFESFSGDGLIVASFDSSDKDLTVEVSRARPWASLFGEYGLVTRAALASRESEVIALNQMTSTLTTRIEELTTSLGECGEHYQFLSTAHKTFVLEANHQQALQQSLLHAAQELNAELAPKAIELRDLKASKIYRWSRRPRTVYQKLRRIGRKK